MTDKNMAYRKCVFAFLDILGYKAIVENIGDDSKRALEYIRQLTNLVEGCVSSIQNYEEMEIEYTIFSDSICIWSYIDEDSNFDRQKHMYSYEYIEHCCVKIAALSQIVASIQIRGLTYETLFRGAITIGKHYHQANVTFSSALVKAYLAESGESIYPRVVLMSQNDDMIISALLDSLENLGLVEEANDWPYIDYLRVMYAMFLFNDSILSHKLNALREMIVKNLRDHRQNPQIYEKYKWLADYFNRKLPEKFYKNLITLDT